MKKLFIYFIIGCIAFALFRYLSAKTEVPMLTETQISTVKVGESYKQVRKYLNHYGSEKQLFELGNDDYYPQCFQDSYNGKDDKWWTIEYHDGKVAKIYNGYVNYCSYEDK